MPNSFVNRYSNSVIGLLQPRLDPGDLALQSLHLFAVRLALVFARSVPSLDAPRLLDRLRRPDPDRPVPLRAKMNIRLPAEVRRLLPRLAGLLQPVPRLGRPRFPRPPFSGAFRL